MNRVRIISGIYRSRLLSLPKLDKNIRPTQDKIRGSVFSSIGDITDFIVLDLFAGTGAYGFESISRNAKFAYFNDINKDCCQAIKKSASLLNCLDKVKIFNLDYLTLLTKMKGVKFDLIFLDPPYKDEVNLKIINFILDKDMLSKNGIIVAEQEIELAQIENLELKQYKYSYKRVGIYRKVN